MKYNLGCGDDIRPGYVNVDFRKTHPSVMEVDLSTYPWPFESESADEILMLDFVEHFPYANTPFILLEAFRIMKSTGTVIIQVPDAVHLSRAVTQTGDYLCNACGGNMYGECPDIIGIEYNFSGCPDCGQSSFDIAHAAVRRLYGGQDYIGNFHQTCFTPTILCGIAASCGLEFVQFEEQDHQWKNWNFMARFKKGDPW